ncbi:MAG: DUF1724 domain-containing protein [Thermoplasmata archaeon]|nr:MAG: DUF1724 domain-containing protein [Thermoplasmata archaeon]
MLKKKPMRLSDISKKLDVTTAEVSRHLERLAKSSLIDRNSDSNYRITSFAEIILSEFSNLDFLTLNKDFFLNHDISPLPKHLRWFASMAEGEIIEGALENASRMWEYNKVAKKYIHVISDEIMRGMVDLTCKKIDQGVDVKKIYPKDAEVPPEYASRIVKNHEIRTLDVIPLSMIITEKNTGMSFRSNNGKVDFCAGFTGDSESFRRWVNAIFDYYWDKAKPKL